MSLPPNTTHQTTTLNGTIYHYLLSLPTAQDPSTPPKITGTIFLLHGWPDLSLGWRNQIRTLLSLDFRIICPDMIGYGRTSAPSSLSKYSFKTAADDLAVLARELGYGGEEKEGEGGGEGGGVVVGGHDWGGMIAHRFALHYPEIVKAVFTVCTPYRPPSRNYIPLEEVVEQVPNFRYQAHLAGEEVEKEVRTKKDIKKFLNALYGGRTEEGGAGFSVKHGVDFKILRESQRTKLMDEEMLDYYTEEYARHGIGPTLNWYRTREINHADEQYLLEVDPPRVKIECPVLFVQATHDTALPPSMSKGMERWAPRLRRREVEASHWALWEKPEEVNKTIEKWMHEDAVPLLSNSKECVTGVRERRGKSML